MKFKDLQKGEFFQVNGSVFQKTEPRVFQIRTSNPYWKEFRMINAVDKNGKMTMFKDKQNVTRMVAKFEESKPILDKVERRYLRNLVQPWRNSVIGVVKQGYINGTEQIVIRHKCFGSVCLPGFDRNTMYAGMELGKTYSLEELGI